MPAAPYLVASCTVRPIRRSELANRGHGREEEDVGKKCEYSVLQFKFEGSILPQLKPTFKMRFPLTVNAL